MLFDAFICHASEDKDEFVRALARKFSENHVEVWYDEFSLNVGDSLRRSIDRGLSQSRFGVVVLSEHFFAKHWSQWELDGLVSRQNSGAQEVILPVWHGVSREEVISYSPPLADKVAANSDLGLDEVVRRLLAVIHPQGSTLVIAREHLNKWGIHPPVISDDWWLDIAAIAESNDLEGSWQEPMGWGRWGFPLPLASKIPAERGWRLAWAAMQSMWRREADSRPVTQLTRPDLVHEFIASQPGLHEACNNNLDYLISYAPQMVIRGFGGDYEDRSEAMYRHSVAAHEGRDADDRYGTALTTDRSAPSCDEVFALRDPSFGRYQPSHVACGFVQGNSVTSGPPVQYYCYIDYVAWILSRESEWVPRPVRNILQLGMAEWGVWPWHLHDRLAIEDFGFEDQQFTGMFAEELNGARTRHTFRPSDAARRDLEHRLSFSARLLRLPEDGETLASRLMTSAFLDSYYARRHARSLR